ncbi:DMT family transporter [Bacillus sp. 165]|uniref:DMT family transporter n=1 Tax=Bacillus sp. 165 TaxID=1529117 RepID=UPI001ADD4819|nr:DMT family transporter [Bacillus sp. 165]
MKANKFFTHPLGIAVSAIFTTFLWGSAFPFIKLSYKELGIGQKDIAEQILFAGYRFFLSALIILLVFSVMGKQMKLQKATAGAVMKIGLFQTFLQYLMFYIGLSFSTGIQGSIIAGTASFFQLILAHFYYKGDSLNTRKFVGLFIGFLGVILVNISRGELKLEFGIGEFLLLLATISYSYGNILAKEGSKKMDVGYLTSYQMLFGSFGLLAIGIVQVGLLPFTFDLKAVLMLLYLSFVSAAGFMIWNTVMKYNQVGKVSMYLFLIPVFGVMLSGLMLNEAIHAFVLLGLVCVATGIIVVNRTPNVKEKTIEKAS